MVAAVSRVGWGPTEGVRGVKEDRRGGRDAIHAGRAALLQMLSETHT